MIFLLRHIILIEIWSSSIVKLTQVPNLSISHAQVLENRAAPPKSLETGQNLHPMIVVTKIFLQVQPKYH